MADLLPPVHPLQSRLPQLADLPDGFAVSTEPYLTMTNVQVRTADARAAAAAVLGTALPTAPNTWVTGPDPVEAVIWLGPEEWLVISSLSALATQETTLRAAIVPHGGAAVDVSGQRVTLVLRGVHVRDVLAKGCAIDLHPSVFGPRSCAQTTLARAGVVLLAADSEDEIVVLVRQSFAAYLADWLTDAAEEFRAPSTGTRR